MPPRGKGKPPAALLNKLKGAAAANAANGSATGNAPAKVVKEEDPTIKEERERRAALENRTLPSKEAGLFKQLLTLYETKQHKKGVKTAEQILKKLPNHGETLAIKALIIHSSLPYNHPTASSQPKGEEADATIAIALRKDPYSHIVHHVNAIIARAKKDFVQSGKSLGRARELDPDNIPLIRDAIGLLTQLGDHQGSLKARHQYFLMRPNLRSNWIMLAVGHELVGDYEEALKIYQGLDETTKDDGLTPLERGELSLHVINVMVKAGKLKEALEQLEDNERAKLIPNDIETIELQASILTQLGRTDEAEIAYRKLLEANPDKLGYYHDLLKLRGLELRSQLSPEQREKVLLVLDGFKESYPRALAPKRLALEVAQGDDFRSRAREYLITGLQKAIPSLFVDMKGLYRDPAKLQAVEEILGELKEQWEAENKDVQDGEITPPTALLWLYYYLALHYAHSSHPSPDYDRSLSLLDVAFKHTPTLPELYMAKAKILKRAGDPEYAARMMEQARLLDLQDRFLNGKAAKYWMRNDQVEKANELLGLFTKKDASSPGQDLLDMQCLWYLTEEADSYIRQGRLGLALKRYKQVLQVFDEIDADRYDFHTYSPRKMTLNAYFQFAEWSRNFRKNVKHVQAAIDACRLLLKVHDYPEIREEKLSPEEEAERKKAAKKARHAENKAKKAAVEGDAKKDEPTLPDADPEGVKYLKEVEPLAAAEALIDPFTRTAGDVAEVWSTVADVAMHQGRFAYATKALATAHALDAENPYVHNTLVRLSIALNKASSPAHEQAVKTALETIVPQDMDLIRLNSEYIQRHSDEARALLIGGITLHDILKSRATDGQLGEQDKQLVYETISQVLAPNVDVDLNVYREAVAFLASPLEASEDQRTEFIGKLRERLPTAWIFAPMQKLVQRREQWALEDEAEKEAAIDEAE